MTTNITLAKQRLPLPALMNQLGHGDRAKKSARCPFHDDGRESFSVFQGKDGSWVWKCHAGCGSGDEPDFLAKASGLSESDAFKEYLKLAGVDRQPPADVSRRQLIAATYDYRDEHRHSLFQVVRFEPKDFRQRRRDPNGDGWIWSLGNTPRVLYRLPEIIAAIEAGEVIYLCEGEKDVHALVDHGFEATCNPGGAGKWLADYTRILIDADVVLLPDKDEPGRNHARLVAENLQGVSAKIRIVELPSNNGVSVKDPADFFATGGTAEQLLRLVNEATPLSGTESEECEADHEIVERAAFPINVLAPDLALMAKGIADAARVPSRLTALCALGMVSAAIGAGLEVRSDPGRTTRGNLFIFVSAESGTGKTTAYELIAAPLMEFQRELQEKWQNETNPGLRAELALLKREIESLEKKAPKITDPNERERIRGEIQYKLALQDQLTRENREPLLVVQDATTEQLASLVHEHGEVMFSASSDCRKVVDNLMGRYAKGDTTDESFYLAGFSGDYVRVDRTSRPVVKLNRPCLSLLWFGQPDLLENLLGEESLSHSGFMPRLLICHSDARPQLITGNSKALPEGISNRWQSLITNLLNQYRLPKQASSSEGHKPKHPVHIIEPTAEATAAMVEYHNEIVERRSKDLTDVGAFAARWAEQAWRLAVVLHAGFYGDKAHHHPLTLETAQNAILLAKWFADEQLSLLTRGRRAAAEKLDLAVLALLEKNIERKSQHYVTARDVHRAHIVRDADAAKALLARMEEEKLLIGYDVTPKGGGKISRQYRSARSQNPVPA